MPQYYDLHALPFNPVSGGSLPFDTISDLAAYDDTEVDNGGIAFTADVRSPWVKVVQTPTAGDGITEIPTASGDGMWVRSAFPAAWNDVTTFYIGGTGAADTNSGKSSSAPLATLDELTRRTYDPVSKRSDFEVQVLGDVTTGTFTTNCEGVEFFGVPTPVAGEEDVSITAIDALVRGPLAVNYVRQKTTAAITWNVDLLYGVKSGGADYVAYGWATKLVNATDAFTRFFEDASTDFYNPVALTDTITPLSLPAVRGRVVAVNGSYVGFYKVNLQIEISGVKGGYAENCRAAVSVYGGDGFSLQNCNVSSGVFFGVNGRDQTSIVSSCINGIVRTDSDLSVDDDCSISGEALSERGFQVTGNAIVSVEGSIEIVGTALAFRLSEPGTKLWFNINSAAGEYLYGSGNTAILSMDYTNTTTVYHTAAALIPTTSGNDFAYVNGAGGSVAGDFAALPSTGVLATRLVGIFPAA